MIVDRDNLCVEMESASMLAPSAMELMIASIGRTSGIVVRTIDNQMIVWDRFTIIFRNMQGKRISMRIWQVYPNQPEVRRAQRLSRQHWRTWLSWT